MKIIRALLLAAALPAAAQDYPARPIRIIVGYAAGGGNDLIVRVMAPRMSEALGQPVIVENKPGAQAIIATEYVAKAAPDGYTILMGPTGPMAMNPATYAKLPYSSTRDFAPISTIGQFPLIVTVGASLPVHSVKELIDYAKKNPGKANYGSSAAAFQIATELFKQRTGTEFVHIPYKSSGESVQATVAGQVTMTICDPPPASGPLRAGTVRALAITSSERHPSWPDVPTLAEAGVPDVEVWLWTGFFAPARTPAAIVARLQRETARVVRLPEVLDGLGKLGVDPVGGSSDELRTRLARDIEKWTAVAKAANIRND
ncbi:MAG TPA: tripartite tricarboxylate transporter substrate binding protein [Burkholderiales bacterium]